MPVPFRAASRGVISVLARSSYHADAFIVVLATNPQVLTLARWVSGGLLCGGGRLKSLRSKKKRRKRYF